VDTVTSPWTSDRKKTDELLLALWHVANDRPLDGAQITAVYTASPEKALAWVRGLAVKTLDGWEPSEPGSTTPTINGLW
jgi:hypothetical protein